MLTPKNNANQMRTRILVKIVEKFLIHMIYKRQISCYIKRVERTKTLCINLLFGSVPI